jgi:hypothetical protein
MIAVIWYWLDGAGKVQVTHDVKIAEKALKEHKQVWGCNKENIDLGLLVASK